MLSLVWMVTKQQRREWEEHTATAAHATTKPFISIATCSSWGGGGEEKEKKSASTELIQSDIWTKLFSNFIEHLVVVLRTTWYLLQRARERAIMGSFQTIFKHLRDNCKQNRVFQDDTMTIVAFELQICVRVEEDFTHRKVHLFEKSLSHFIFALLWYQWDAGR